MTQFYFHQQDILFSMKIKMNFKFHQKTHLMTEAIVRLIYLLYQPTTSSLYTKSCSLSGEGEISLGMNYGPVKMKSFGKIDYNQNSKKTSLNLSLRIDIPLDRKIMESLANKIKLEDQFRLMKLKSSNFDRAMMHWAGEKTTNKIIESFIEDSKAPKFPLNLKTLYF